MIDENRFTMQLRTMQIITLALVMGPTIFAIVVIVMHATGRGPQWDQPIMLTWLALGMVAIMAIVSNIVLGIMTQAALKSHCITYLAAATWGRARPFQRRLSQVGSGPPDRAADRQCHAGRGSVLRLHRLFDGGLSGRPGSARRRHCSHSAAFSNALQRSILDRGAITANL